MKFLRIVAPRHTWIALTPLVVVELAVVGVGGEAFGAGFVVAFVVVDVCEGFDRSGPANLFGWLASFISSRRFLASL